MRKGVNMNPVKDLEYRGLLYQVTDREGLVERVEDKPLTLYIGFDPTADSLHIGNLLQILLLRRFQLAGHHPIAVVGGGTGLVGDPSGKSGERKLNTVEVVEAYTAKVRQQLEQYLDFSSTENPARVVNNYEWLGGLELIPFLRDIGKYFPIGAMLAKDSVKSRLDAGISFTEFSYMILQAYDFLQLKGRYGCELQAGGSDQWGNITAGVDLIRRATADVVYGLTQPLITQSDGKKLGKTEQGTVWLDASLTTPYQFYQYWINIPDDDVIQFLKYFTFLDQEDISGLEEAVAQEPWKRVAQRRLAQEVTTMVHGQEAFESAEKISNALFYGKVSELSVQELEQGLHDVPSYELRGRESISLVDLLVDADICHSKRRAREDIANGAITINDQRRRDQELTLLLSDRIAGRYLVVRRGKNKYHLIQWRS
jgi:tyrosyl-tRNA synthetase